VSGVDFLYPTTWTKLIAGFKTLSAALSADAATLTKAGLVPAEVTAWLGRPSQVAASERLLASKEIRVVLLDDPEYPESLREIADPPLWLFVRGSLKPLAKRCLTVVGTRTPSGYAQTALKTLLPDTIAGQLTVVSGLAYGIDKLAHQISLESGGKTIAVLAGGLDAIYPIDHHQLAEKIVASGGALVSEYPPLSRPKPYRFPIRNRILAGLSALTVVVEANIRSGSLTTARSALDYNRDIWAVPGDIARAQAAGTNYLIKEGATLLDSSDQIKRYYGLKTKRRPSELVGENQELLQLLGTEPFSVEQLVDRTKRPLPDLLGALTELELLGVVARDSAGGYTRTRKK
jgi:DNA processing protein